MMYRAAWIFATSAAAALVDKSESTHHPIDRPSKSHHKSHHKHKLHHHLQQGQTIGSELGLDTARLKIQEISSTDLKVFNEGDIIDQDSHVHYEVIRFLGRGEYGTVYEAYRCISPGRDTSEDWIS